MRGYPGFLGRKHSVETRRQNCLPDNLISLCKTCNSKVNSNRDYWQVFFEVKIAAEIDDINMKLTKLEVEKI